MKGSHPRYINVGLQIVIEKFVKMLSIGISETPGNGKINSLHYQLNLHNNTLNIWGFEFELTSLIEKDSQGR